MRERKILTLLVLFILGITLVMGAPDPSGATLTPGASSRGTNPGVGNLSAQAGNVTALNIDQTRITDIWQGYYGNVSGSIVLENSAGNNFYDWTIAAITGEVYASRNTVSSWSSINCTNRTQWEAEETALNIGSTLTDGINETYNANNHPAFDVGTRTMNSCPSTRPYNATGVAGQFWNILLNSDVTNVIYASRLADNSNSFDNGTADFEILVPTNRTTGLSTYFFYVELY